MTLQRRWAVDLDTGRQTEAEAPGDDLSDDAFGLVPTTKVEIAPLPKDADSTPAACATVHDRVASIPVWSGEIVSIGSRFCIYGTDEGNVAMLKRLSDDASDVQQSRWMVTVWTP